MQASYGSDPKCDKRRNESPDRLITKSVKDAKNMYLYIISRVNILVYLNTNFFILSVILNYKPRQK